MDGDGARLTLVGEWRVGGPGAQRRVAQAAVAAWRGRWPEGLLGYRCLLGEDGGSVLHVTRWTGEAAARGFAGGGKGAWARDVDAAAPGIERRGVTAYRWYRGTTPVEAPPPAGCVVTVTVTLERPGAGRQRAWVDHVFAAAGTDAASPTAGLLAAHFHLSLDGIRILNLAEWTTPEAHRAAVTPAPDAFRARVREFPGVAATVTRRHVPYRDAHPPRRCRTDGAVGP